MSKLCLCLPVWSGRSAMRRAVLRTVARYYAGQAVDLVWAVSQDEDSAALAYAAALLDGTLESGAVGRILRWDNMPVGEKKNALWRSALLWSDADYFVDVSDDDLLAPRYLSWLAGAGEKFNPHVLYPPTSAYFFDVETARHGYAATGYGSGRALHRDLADRLVRDGGPWDPGWSKFLDTSLDGALHGLDVRRAYYVHDDAAREGDPLIVACKTDVNLWPFHDALAIGRGLNTVGPGLPPRFARLFPSWLGEELLRIHNHFDTVPPHA